jgi:hypothetical protein
MNYDRIPKNGLQISIICKKKPGKTSEMTDYVLYYPCQVLMGLVMERMTMVMTRNFMSANYRDRGTFKTQAHEVVRFISLINYGSPPSKYSEDQTECFA